MYHIMLLPLTSKTIKISLLVKAALKEYTTRMCKCTNKMHLIDKRLMEN